MAEVLEAMGFPSEWCERALKSASGIETAVDLLLQWQAHGMPQLLPSSVRPSSPSSGRSKELQSNSRSLSGGGPTLRLHPLPTTASKAVVDDREKSPSSTLIPSSSSPGPSSLDGPSGINHSSNSDSPSSSFARSPSGLGRSTSFGRIVGSEQPRAGRLAVAVTGNSGVENASVGPQGRAGSSRRTDNLDSSDAVVPDAYAEERKARYSAARRAKQEKEDEKARIRQHVQEDMALRRLRRSYQAPSETEMFKSATSDHVEKRAGGSNTPRAPSADTAVELQIRCPGSQNLKASFTAGASLKDVRNYVENHLQQALKSLTPPDNFTARTGAVPFSGPSARLSSNREAERQLLQAARENFEVQTSRILASAKTMRNNTETSEASRQNGAAMYFLIPFPRQEFFTESTMETTLAEAQLVPRGTLVVHFRPSEVQMNIAQPQSCYSNEEDLNKGGETTGDASNGYVQTSVANVDESTGLHTAGGSEAEVSRVLNFETSGESFGSMNEAFKSGRTLETEGERVRVRELALQAAAKRMREAAKIFRAGLPLGEGEHGEGFHFPRDGENLDEVNAAAPTKVLQDQVAIISESVPLRVDNLSLNVKAAGADAELNASPTSVEHSPQSDGLVKFPPDRSLDTLHCQAMAAAELRIRNSQSQPNVMGGVYNQEPDEAESRIGEDEPESRSRRMRIPQSSRLLSRPEKLQRTSNNSPPSRTSQDIRNNSDQEMVAGSSRQQSRPCAGAPRTPGPLEAALQRFKAISEGDGKGKGIAEEEESLQIAVPSTSIQAQPERNSSLRVRLEDGNVVLHTFPANTLLQSVRDSVVPEGAVASAYGFVVPFPEPHFVEGEGLDATLEEVGLVPRGSIHLTKLATRGVVRQGRRVSRRRRYLEDSDDEMDPLMEGIFGRLAEHITNHADLTYEQLMELEESIGKVHVGVPEEIITTLPTHIVKAKKAATSVEGLAGVEEEMDLCIVCMAEMADGEEALSLPCVHTFHTLCIRQWLLQSTCCPTCKQSLV